MTLFWCGFVGTIFILLHFCLLFIPFFRNDEIKVETVDYGTKYCGMFLIMIHIALMFTFSILPLDEVDKWHWVLGELFPIELLFESEKKELAISLKHNG